MAEDTRRQWLVFVQGPDENNFNKKISETNNHQNNQKKNQHGKYKLQNINKTAATQKFFFLFWEEPSLYMPRAILHAAC